MRKTCKCIIFLLFIAILLSACEMPVTAAEETGDLSEEEEANILPMLSVKEAGPLYDAFVGEWVSSGSEDHIRIHADGMIELNDFNVQTLYLVDVPYEGTCLACATLDNEYYRIKGRDFFRLDLGSFVYQDSVLTYHRPADLELITDELLAILPENETVFLPCAVDELPG